MATATKFKMSQARYDALVEELNYLQTVREKEVAEQIKLARSFGDLSENSEYDEAKTEQGKLYSKIAEMKKVLKHAQVIEHVDHAATGVSLGSRVTVRETDTGEEEVYEIVGSQEADPLQMRISDDSPIGRAIIGQEEGAIVKVEAPAGAFELEIVSITRD